MAKCMVNFLTKEQFQAQIDALDDGGILELCSYEYPGPVEIKKAITIEGNGATFWSMKGPVCHVKSQNVTLKNLRIEITTESLGDEGCALKVDDGKGIHLENIEVRGSVQGLPPEEGLWLYPFKLSLEEIEPGEDHIFLLRLYVPVPCKISSAMNGINVTPEILKPGQNEVSLNVNSSLKNVLLLGHLTLQTAFLNRHINVVGRVSAGNLKRKRTEAPRILYEPPDWSSLGPVKPKKVDNLPIQKPAVITLPDKINQDESSASVQQPGGNGQKTEQYTKQKARLHKQYKMETPCPDSLFLTEAPDPISTDAGIADSSTIIPSMFLTQDEETQDSNDKNREKPTPEEDVITSQQAKVEKAESSQNFSHPPADPPKEMLNQKQKISHNRVQSIPIDYFFSDPEAPGVKPKEQNDADSKEPQDSDLENHKSSKKKKSKEFEGLSDVFMQ